MSNVQLSPIEEEIVALKAVTNIIDGMVNYEILARPQNESTSSIQFQSSTHQRLFNILLVDFLSQSDKRGPVEQTSFLGALRRICENPQFNTNASVTDLGNATRTCIEWLNYETPVDVWLPSIDIHVEPRLPRITYVKMCGNIAKHDMLRLVTVADQLQAVLVQCGVAVEREDALLALDDFYKRFHTDILNYHGSTIVQLLNDIRWGVHEYLLPEFQHSFTQEDCTPPMYRYKYPDEMKNKFAQRRYWDLMNDIRSKPILPRFQVADVLRRRY